MANKSQLAADTRVSVSFLKIEDQFGRWDILSGNEPKRFRKSWFAFQIWR